MQILISSFIDYYTKTLPPLLASLSGSGVPSGSITVVIGGVSGSIDTGSFAGVNIQTIPQNLFELNALYWQAHQRVELQPSQSFLLHDTCTVSASFWQNIKDTKGFKMIHPLEHSFMGAYPKPLHALKPWLSSFANCKDDKLRKYATGFFMQCWNQPLFTKPSYGNSMIRNPEQVDFYGTGTLRWVDHYPNSGVIKYRSNTNPNVTMNL